jgi:hypothetical protein
MRLEELRHPMKRQTLALFSLAGLLLATAACGSVRINRINADPGQFRNRTVSVTGRVVNAVGVLGTGGYQVDDGTGRLYVISRTGVPAKGTKVKVTGTVVSGVNVFGTSVGTALREHEHKAKW